MTGQSMGRTEALFPDYLKGFVSFTQSFFERALELTADDADTQPLVRVLADTANSAAQEAAAELGRVYDQSSETSRGLADRQLQLSGGMTLIRSASNAVANPGAHTKGGLAWIGVIIHLLKKLLKILFGKKIPQWLHRLLDFIDELWQVLQSLLGGREASQLAHEMTTRYLIIERLFNAIEVSPEASPASEG